MKRHLSDKPEKPGTAYYLAIAPKDDIERPLTPYEKRQAARWKRLLLCPHHTRTEQKHFCHCRMQQRTKRLTACERCWKAMNADPNRTIQWITHEKDDIQK